MITLLTGTNGAGKTAWLMNELTKLPAQRKLYQHGIPELKLPHEPIYCDSPDCEYCREQTRAVYSPTGAFEYYEEVSKPGVPVLMADQWPEWATHGSLIVLDEVQRVWRSSHSTAKPSKGITALETHRHKGLDFWIITQSPKLIHTNVRELTGRHIHLVAKWFSRKEYEWPEIQDNIRSGRNDAVQRTYKLPKHVFKLYKSASLHTKLEKRIPLAVYALVAAVLFTAGMGYRVYGRFVQSTSTPAKTEAVQPAAVVASAAPSGGAVVVAANAAATTAPANPLPDFKPVVDGVPESAPAYAGLIKVQSVPLLAGCVLNKRGDTCKCYTAQATPYPATPEYCHAVVKGERFNPYLPPIAAGAVHQPAPPPSG